MRFETMTQVTKNEASVVLLQFTFPWDDVPKAYYILYKEERNLDLCLPYTSLVLATMIFLYLFFRVWNVGSVFNTSTLGKVHQIHNEQDLPEAAFRHVENPLFTA